jgi:hypothetical protein
MGDARSTRTEAGERGTAGTRSDTMIKKKKKTASRAKRKVAVKDLPAKAGHEQSVKGGVRLADSYMPRK